jgi:hypothetical protein
MAAEDSEKPEPLEYEVYVRERENLYKYQQSNWASYEKTIVTLSAAFLAFSVSFLGLVKKEPILGAPPETIKFLALLITSWVLFAASVLLILLSFPANAGAFDVETRKIEDALSDGSALDRRNKWTRLGYTIYALAGTSFIAGIVLLLVFCAHNSHLF